MGNTAELDKELVDGLKVAKTKRCYFALVLKGGTDGALLVSKTKIPAPAIAEAKKSSGGSAVVQGFVSYADGAYIFETAKDAPATAAQAVKAIAKRDAGLSIHADFRKGTDPELAGIDGDHAGQTTTAPTQTTPQAGVETTQHGPLPEAGKYAAALQEWEQAAATALETVDDLIASLEEADDELATEIAKIVAKLKADFPDTLDEALTNLADAANAGKTSETEAWRNKSEIAIKAALSYLGNNAKTIDGCETNPFGVSVAMREPLTAALKQVLIKIKK